MFAEQVSSSDTIYVPNPVLEQTKLSGKWVGNDLSVNTSSSTRSIHLSGQSYVYSVTTEAVLFNPVMRKLVNESCLNFLSGQSLKNMPISTSRPELVNLSKNYRSIIRSCTESLYQETISCENETDCEVNKDIVAILQNIEFIWHLTEILHVEAVSGDAVISQLVEWLNIHYPETDEQAIDMLNSTRLNQDIAVNGIESHYPEFWHVIINLVLQGNLELVRALLKLHSASDTEMFKEADRALRKRPAFSMYDAMSMSEYIVIWRAWHASVKDEIRTGLYKSEKNLESIMKIIVGDVSMANRIKEYCNTWYKYMIVTLLYSEPTIISYDLSYHAHQCISQYGGTAAMKPFDTIMLALFDSDLKQMVNKLQLTSDCGWTALHMTNLLRLCGKLNFEGSATSFSSRKVSQLEEQLLLEYGSLLMKHKSLWQLGIYYLDHCPSYGAAYEENFLLSIPFQTETKALKIIDIARDRNLTSVVNTVCKVQGQRCLQEGRLGNALTWAFRSENSAFATQIADKFLYEFMDISFFTTTDLLDNLGSCMLLCDRLIFLAKYYEFHQLHTTGKLKDAASLLSQLLISKLVPKFFWPTLLNDAVSLLQNHDKPLLSTSETQNLMFCFEELLHEKNPLPQLQEKENVIRVALMKNLSRSFIRDLSNDKGDNSDFIMNS